MKRATKWWPLVLLGLAVTAPACVGAIGDGSPDGGNGDGTVDQGLCGADKPFVRRLTLDEYSATIEAALSVDIRDDAEAALPADLRADGFSNTSNALIVTLDHVEAYATLAEVVASRVDLEDLAQLHGGCSSFGDACERDVVTGLATTLFRHPPTDEEIEALLPLFDAAETEGDGFTVAVGLVLETLLQSPRFLYRIERERGEGSVALDGYEIASRLSYFLWGAPPDEGLLADVDRLTDDAAIEAQVDRMLKDPRAIETAQRFLVDWLDLHRLDNLQRDPAAFPDWDPALGRDMKLETIQFFTHLALDEKRPLADLFDAQLTFVTPALADHYGFEAPADAEQPVSLSDLPERGGLLTQGAVAAVGGNTSSMVGRGLYILENILCGHLADPPPGVDTTPPEISADTPQREVSEQRVADSACGGCHIQIEPVAWGIERFDATGRYVLEDRYGNPLSQDGTVVLEDGNVEFSSVAELGNLLADSDRVKACVGRKSAQYALGRQLDFERDSDQCTDDEVSERFRSSSGTYRDLILAIALSTSFRHVEGQK